MRYTSVFSVKIVFDLRRYGMNFDIPLLLISLP